MIKEVIVDPYGKIKWDSYFEDNLLKLLPSNTDIDIITITFIYSDQCNFYFSPEFLGKLSELGITLAISADEDNATKDNI
jgi:hypothetical protein